MQTLPELFAARVPRYTSYPTAPHFHAGVDAQCYRAWLDELDPSLPLSLYIHVPFCDTLCWFCGCHTTVVRRYSPVENYLELLAREIDLLSVALGRRRVSHIHWGGGSPTILKPADILRLSERLHRHFSIAQDCEFAVEIDPRGFEAETARALADAGVSRASIGVQDCNIEVQKAINRIQSMETTAEAVERLRRVGISSLNVDLIYGLPLQTVSRLEKTVESALTLEPDRLAIFGYAHVPSFKKHQLLIPESSLPKLEERFAQAEAARLQLCASGYVAIGLDHFAKPGDKMAMAQRCGRLARNFQGYTTDIAPALIGIGASAIGSLPQGYVQNIADVPGYRAALAAGRLPIARGVALTQEDRARRAIIERLMCDLRVDIDEIAAEFAQTRGTFRDSIAALEPLVVQGAVTIDGGRIVIADAWRAATRLVCAAFDTYLAGGAARHAIAV